MVNVDEARVRAMLAEGVSHREIARTLGVSRKVIDKRYPGTGWTYTQAGAFGREVRRANDRMPS